MRSIGTSASIFRRTARERTIRAVQHWNDHANSYFSQPTLCRRRHQSLRSSMVNVKGSILPNRSAPLWLSIPSNLTLALHSLSQYCKKLFPIPFSVYGGVGFMEQTFPRTLSIGRRYLRPAFTSDLTTDRAVKRSGALRCHWDPLSAK